jgi:hypothetical protein
MGVALNSQQADLCQSVLSCLRSLAQLKNIIPHRGEMRSPPEMNIFPLSPLL